MQTTLEKWDTLIGILQSIKTELQSSNGVINNKAGEYVHFPFKGCEIYLLHKAFIDSGGAPHESYKTLLEKTVPYISNKTQKGFSAQSFCKYSDKVDLESKG